MFRRDRTVHDLHDCRLGHMFGERVETANVPLSPGVVYTFGDFRVFGRDRNAFRDVPRPNSLLVADVHMGRRVRPPGRLYVLQS